MGRAEREKGKRGESELAGILRRLLGLSGIRRGRQYHGLEGRDLVGWPGVHVECKRRQRLNVARALEQAAADAKPGEVPVVFWRADGEPWLMVVELENLPALARSLPAEIVKQAAEQAQQ